MAARVPGSAGFNGRRAHLALRALKAAEVREPLLALDCLSEALVLYRVLYFLKVNRHAAAPSS